MGWAQSITIKVASLNADTYSARTGEVAIPERRAGGRYVHVSSRPDLSGVTAAVSLHCGENPALNFCFHHPAGGNSDTMNMNKRRGTKMDYEGWVDYSRR